MNESLAIIITAVTACGACGAGAFKYFNDLRNDRQQESVENDSSNSSLSSQSSSSSSSCSSSSSENEPEFNNRLQNFITDLTQKANDFTQRSSDGSTDIDIRISIHTESNQTMERI